MTGDVKPYARRWPALMVLAASLLVVSIGNTILNLALPSIRDDLDASSSELQWILDGHMLVFAGLLLVAGSLGDRFGRRRTLFVGPGDVRPRLAAGRAGARHDRADRFKGADGRRRGRDHARHALGRDQQSSRPRSARRRSRSGRRPPGWASRSARSAAAG